MSGLTHEFVLPILFVIVFSALLSFAFTSLLLKIAHKYRLYDKVEERKVHSGNIPRIGGAGIFTSFFLALLVSELLVQKTVFHRPHNMTVFFIYLLSLLTIFLLGLLDDIKGLNAPEKFLVQFAVATVLFFCGFKIKIISLPSGGALNIGIFAFPLTLFWIVGVINAINIIDGLDGLAAGISLFASISMLIMLAFNGDVTFIVIIAALIGSLLGFLPFNLNPAKIFMGDCGSLFIGLLLSTLAIKSSQKASLSVSLAVPIMILMLPIIDTLLAIYRRAINHKPLFSADKDHIHHRMLKILKSHRAASMTLTGISALFSGIGLMMHFASPGLRLTLLGISFFAIFSFLYILGYFNGIKIYPLYWLSNRISAEEKEKGIRR